jgi:hypothetical protein
LVQLYRWFLSILSVLAVILHNGGGITCAAKKCGRFGWPNCKDARS